MSSYPPETQPAHSNNQILHNAFARSCYPQSYIQSNILIIAKMTKLFFASLSLLAFQDLVRQVAAEPIEDPFFHPNPPFAQPGDNFYFEAVHHGEASNSLTSAAVMTPIIEAGGYVNTMPLQLRALANQTHKPSICWIYGNTYCSSWQNRKGRNGEPTRIV
jgi:hypothetical protein